MAVLSYAASSRFSEDPAAIGRALRIEGGRSPSSASPRRASGVAVGMSPDVTIPMTMPRLGATTGRAGQRTTSGSTSWAGPLRHVDRAGRRRVPDGVGAGAPRRCRRLAPSAPARDVHERPRVWRFRLLARSTPVQAALWLLFGLVAVVLVVACATGPAACGRGRAPPGTGAAAAIGASRARLVSSCSSRPGARARRRGSDCSSRPGLDLLVRLLSTATTRDDGARRRRPRARVHGGRHRHRGARLASRRSPGPSSIPDRFSGRHRGRAAIGGLRASPERWSPRRCTVDGPAGGLGALRAQPDPVADGRRLRPQWPRAQRRRALAGERARGSRDRAQDLALWYGELLRRLRETPGVRSASLSRKPPISNELGYSFESFTVEGRPADGPWPTTASGRTFLNAVSPGYFATVGTAFIAGRDFSASDGEAVPRRRDQRVDGRGVLRS